MGDVADLHDPTPENASRDVSFPDGSPRFSSRRWTKIREAWENNLDPGERSAVWAWTAFAVTFGGVRVLTHWIRAGHGPSGGGIVSAANIFTITTSGSACSPASGPSRCAALNGTVAIPRPQLLTAPDPH